LLAQKQIARRKTQTHIFTHTKLGSHKHIACVSIMSYYPASTKRFNSRIVTWIQPCYIFRQYVPFSVRCPVSFYCSINARSLPV